jgi:hypothetical protein
MRKYKYGVTFIALVAAAGAVLLVARPQRTAGARDMPQIRFYGQVVDDAGSPVADATVHLSIWTVPRGEWSSAKGPSLDKVTKHAELHTRSDGTFELVNARGYMVQVLDVRKPGYVWLVDLAWSLPGEVHPDNRFFIYGGNPPLYMPDAAKPAVLPLYRTGGNGGAAQRVDGGGQVMPSRGGADRAADGHVTPNAPVRPRVPTTGPGAPPTAIEASKRLRALARPRGRLPAAEAPGSSTRFQVKADSFYEDRFAVLRRRAFRSDTSCPRPPRRWGRSAPRK